MPSGSIQTGSAMWQENPLQASSTTLALKGRDRIGIRRSGHSSKHSPGTFAFRRYRSDKMSSAFFVHSYFGVCHVLASPGTIGSQARSVTQRNQTSF